MPFMFGCHTSKVACIDALSTMHVWLLHKPEHVAKIVCVFALTMCMLHKALLRLCT